MLLRHGQEGRIGSHLASRHAHSQVDRASVRVQRHVLESVSRSSALTLGIGPGVASSHIRYKAVTRRKRIRPRRMWRAGGRISSCCCVRITCFLGGSPMKDGLRFVDSDMHVMEPPDLFERYLDPKYRDRVTVRVGADGRPNRGPAGMILIDGRAHLGPRRPAIPQATTRPVATNSTQPPLSGSRIHEANRLDFAIERDYDAEAQVHGHGRWKASISPCSIPRWGWACSRSNGIDPRLSLAMCQAYNNWIHEFCQLQPRAPEVRGDAAHARRAPRLPRAGAVRAGAGRRRLLHPAEPDQRALLALELLGSALHRARGARRDVGIPRRRERASTRT